MTTVAVVFLSERFPSSEARFVWYLGQMIPKWVSRLEVVFPS